MAIAALPVALAAAGMLPVWMLPIVLFPFVVAGSVYAVWRLATGPLSRAVARLHYSLRWKVLVAIGTMALPFVILSVISQGAMDYMHQELHRIQELGETQPWRVRAAVDALEQTQHGPLFSLAPLLGLLVALVALGLGVAIAWSVIDPLRSMGQAMRRIAAGDFSHSLRIPNRDELGELAARINATTGDLAKLRQATLAEERARALRERMVQITLTQEEERRRLSRELHDGLGPSLAAIGNRLRISRSLVHTQPDQAVRELDEVIDALKAEVRGIRELIYDLRPPALDQLRLVGALRQHVERFADETGIQATLVVPEDPAHAALDSASEITVFRVAQESLSNVQQHSGASQVTVQFEREAAGLMLAVSDNGRGFDSSTPGPAGTPHGPAVGSLGTGMGLRTMRERAELVGGSLTVETSPGAGCRVVLRTPATVDSGYEDTRVNKGMSDGAHTSPARR